MSETNTTTKTNPLTDEQKNAVGAIIAEQLKPMLDPIKSMVERAETSAGRIEQIEAKLTELSGKLDGTGKADDDAKKIESTGNEATDAIIAKIGQLGQSIEENNKRLDGFATEREADKQRQSSMSIAEATVAKTLPNLSTEQRAIFVSRIAASDPKTPEDATKMIEAIKKEQATFGTDITKLCADPSAEGATQPAGSSAGGKQADDERTTEWNDRVGQRPKSDI